MSTATWEPITCLVTDRRRLVGASVSFVEQVAALERVIATAVAAGVDLIQVREPDLESRDLLTVARLAVDAARGFECRIVVNDRLDVALAAGADGVHLRASGAPVPRVRACVPPGWLIGRSAHSPAEVAAAATADYIVFGTVFDTASKPGVMGQGLTRLAAAVGGVTVPVLAIGGINAGNVAQCAEVGAKGVAAISLLTSHEGDVAALGDLIRHIKGHFVSLT